MTENAETGRAPIALPGMGPKDPPAEVPASVETAAAEPPPLTGMQLVAGTVALSAATFMVVLDTSIANVSIPAISGDVGVHCASVSINSTWT